MRILFVVNYAEFFLSHRAPLAIAAAALGHDVHVATQDGPLVAKVRELGFPFHTLPRMRGRTRLTQEPRTVIAMARLFRRLRPDLVHLVSIKPVVYGGIAARLSGVPAVVSAVSGLGSVFLARGPWAEARRRAVVMAYRSALAHRNIRVIVQNEDDRRFVIERLGTAAERVEVIEGSGVDTSRFEPSPAATGRLMVLLTGRMLRDKGVVEYVEAARLCRARGVNARFVLVGGTDPDNPSALTASQLRAWESEGVIEWWGHRDDVAQILEEASVVCLPSYREGLSKSLIEAAASGKAIVTTDVPGCREVVGDDCGITVPPRDAVALSQALERLLEDGPLRARLGARARDRAVQRFSLDAVVARTMAIYRTLSVV